MMIVASLQDRLPSRYVAEPRVHIGAMVEIDVATFDRDSDESTHSAESGGGLATAAWAPPEATLAVAADLPAQDEYAVRIYDRHRGRRLVAAIEIVSPANKDRPEHRRAFVAQCAGLLQDQVSVIVIDPVTTRSFNLYADLLDHIGQSDPLLGVEPPATYAVACRTTQQNGDWLVETWFHQMNTGESLPTLPVWLADDLAIPLPLEDSYEQTCHILRLP